MHAHVKVVDARIPSDARRAQIVLHRIWEMCEVCVGDRPHGCHAREGTMHVAFVRRAQACWSLGQEAKDHANEGGEIGDHAKLRVDP